MMKTTTFITSINSKLESSTQPHYTDSMKISELIMALEDAKQQYGDIHVGFDREDGSFDWVEYLQPLYPKNESCIEQKDKPVWCIELR
jgi:hypothetical protein